jgi:hypothetical protein
MVNSWGLALAQSGALSRALGPTKENNYALDPRKEYIVSGCRKLKRKFRLRAQVEAVGHNQPIRKAKTEISVETGLRGKKTHG